MKLLVFVALCLAYAVAEEATEQSEPLLAQFTQAAQSLPQLAAQEEYQRRLADLMIGSQQAMYFQQMAMLELHAVLDDNDRTATNAVLDRQDFMDDDDLEEDALLELESTSKPFYSPVTHGMAGMYGYGMFPAYGMGMGMGMGMGAKAQDPVQLAKNANMAKVAALKFAHIQISTAAGDVEKSYWMNKIMQTALPPQFLIYKVYKNYLSTVALSLAIQVHDAFTLEAYLENFNLNHPEAGDSALAAEARAELLLYSKWHMLATLRFQLFYLGMYEHMSAMHMAQPPMQPQQQNPSSFVELEEEAEPVQFHDPRFMMTYSHYLSMYKYYLQYSIIASEMSLTQMGMWSASTAVNRFSNDAEVDDKMVEMGAQMTKMLPHAMASWASATSSKYMIEYYSMIMDMYSPMFAAARDAQRASSAMENTNFVQTEQPVAQ